MKKMESLLSNDSYKSIVKIYSKQLPKIETATK